MSKIQYRSINVGSERQAVIERASSIAQEYAAQGYDLTLRQLYYQFVARGLIANRDVEYKRLGDTLNDARLAGLFDWAFLVDRTREVAGGDAGDWTPDNYLRALARSYSEPYWKGQDTRIEVWVEKEALAGVVERAAGEQRVAHFSCRGYTSASSLWSAAQRLEAYLDTAPVEHPTTGAPVVVERVVVLHLGDHDPSGIDMTRDITDRLHEFLEGDGYDASLVEVKRIALNMDQVNRYNQPPNPAKITDSRANRYIANYGAESWELDALDPATLNELITREIEYVIDTEAWTSAVVAEAANRAQLVKVAGRWNDVTAFVNGSAA